jgi:hypothetical protein
MPHRRVVLGTPEASAQPPSRRAREQSVPLEICGGSFSAPSVASRNPRGVRSNRAFIEVDVEPNGTLADIADFSFDVTWQDADPDDNAAIELAYSTGPHCAGALPLATGIQEDSAVDAPTWFTSEVPDGLYWVRASIVDLEGASAIAFYVDAALHETRSGSPSLIPDRAGPFIVGTINHSPNCAFDGLIDEVRVWNYARSASQILADYDNAITPPLFGLVGDWRFSGDLLDSSGLGNHLQASGTPLFAPGSPF